MGSVPPLLSFLLMVAAGWVNRQQLIIIEFLQAENQLLKQRLRGKRLRFTDAERALLARKAKAVGRKALLKLDTIVSPDTLLRWHRRWVAQKWNFAHRRSPGRPHIMREIAELIARMAQDNPRWGYSRIQGALANLHHRVGRGPIANVLKCNGIEPAPERGRHTKWSTFLKAHWKVLAASDFLTVEVWTGRGLVTYYLLFVISLVDRVVQVAGITARPGARDRLGAGGRTGDGARTPWRLPPADSLIRTSLRRILARCSPRVFQIRATSSRHFPLPISLFKHLEPPLLAQRLLTRLPANERLHVK